MLAPQEESYDKPRQCIKKERYRFASKMSCFSSSHVRIWELDHKAEHQRIDALELWCWRRLLRVPWIARSSQSILKEINLNIHWKDWYWSWRSNTLATWRESRPIGKDPDAGKDWRQKEKRVEEDEMVGWHHQLDRHESEQTLGDSKEHGSLECFSPWGCKESDTTEQLNKTLMSLIGGLSVEWWKENLS